MCRISLTSIIASSSTSILIQGQVTGECTRLEVDAAFPGETRHGEAQLTPGTTSGEQNWSKEFAGFEASALRDWCKNTVVTVTAKCVDKDGKEQCKRDFSESLVCCPTFSIIGSTFAECKHGTRAGTWSIKIDWPHGFAEDVSLKLTLWFAGDPHTPDNVASYAFFMGANQNDLPPAPIYPMMAPSLQPNTDYEGEVHILTPTRCEEHHPIARFTVPDCDCPPAPTPEQLLTVKNPDGSVVNDPDNTGCVNGDHAIVTAGNWPGSNPTWSATTEDTPVPFTVDPNDPRSISVDLPDDGTRVVITALIRDGSCDYPVPISAKRCGATPPPPCDPVPSDYELKVLDANGNEIPPNQCVPGDRAEVVAPDHEGPVVWQLDGQPANADAALPRRLRVSLNDNDEHTVEATVGRDNCSTPKKRTLKRCPPTDGGGHDDGPQTDSRIDICSLVRFFILIGIGIAAIGAVLLGCPQFTLGLFGQYQWVVGLVVLVLGVFIAIVALAIAVLLAVARICPMTWCDWLTLFWQGLFLIGVLFIFASFCPGCFWFALGWLVLLAAGVFFILWIMRCRPTPCSIFHQLLLLMVVFDICQIMEAILGRCVITGNPLLALVWGIAVLVFNAYVTWGLHHYRCLRN